MARYPAFESFLKRKESFTSSFPIRGITPSEFAEAGFYSIGIQDYTRCFYCGVGLRGWDNTDDPFKQHAKFASTCQYLINEKGESFVVRQSEVMRKLVDSDNLTDVSSKRKNVQQNAISPPKLIDKLVAAYMSCPEIRLVLKYQKTLGYNTDDVKKFIKNCLIDQNEDFKSPSKIACELLPQGPKNLEYFTNETLSKTNTISCLNSSRNQTQSINLDIDDALNELMTKENILQLLSAHDLSENDLRIALKVKLMDNMNTPVEVTEDVILRAIDYRDMCIWRIK